MVTTGIMINRLALDVLKEVSIQFTHKYKIINATAIMKNWVGNII